MKLKPSLFCKIHLNYHNVKSYEFTKKYFSDSNVLVNAIKEYVRVSQKQKGENTLLERFAVDERHDAIEKFIAIADQADGNDRRPNLRHPNPIVDDVLERLDGDIAAPGTPIDVFDADGENVDEIFVHSSVGNF